MKQTYGIANDLQVEHINSSFLLNVGKIGGPKYGVNEKLSSVHIKAGGRDDDLPNKENLIINNVNENLSQESRDVNTEQCR